MKYASLPLLALIAACSQAPSRMIASQEWGMLCGNVSITPPDHEYSLLVPDGISPEPDEANLDRLFFNADTAFPYATLSPGSRAWQRMDAERARLWRGYASSKQELQPAGPALLRQYGNGQSLCVYGILDENAYISVKYVIRQED